MEGINSGLEDLSYVWTRRLGEFTSGSRNESEFRILIISEFQNLSEDYW
jgi:hypothetical protein